VSYHDPRAFQPVFLDIEASGLDGWPIEVAWVEIDPDGSLRAESHLIRPEPDWDLQAWDNVAEQLHGISLAQLLREGRPAFQVAARVVECLDGRMVVSDAADRDTGWLRELLLTHADEIDIPVIDLLALVRRLDPPAALRLLQALQADAVLVHRAAQDATRLARAWMVAVGPVADAV
jgi:DNA polymerase III epsilon subunit-like protein